MAHSIAVEDEPGGPVIIASGDLDLTSARDLAVAIDRVADKHDVVTIDLSGATLLDSRTIGVLTGWAKRLRTRNATMPIVCDNPNVLRLFSTMGLDREFEFFPSREAAAGS